MVVGQAVHDLGLLCVISKPDVHAPRCPKPLVRGEGGAVPWAFVDSLTLPRGESAFEREGESLYS